MERGQDGPLWILWGGFWWDFASPGVATASPFFGGGFDKFDKLKAHPVLGKGMGVIPTPSAGGDTLDIVEGVHITDPLFGVLLGGGGEQRGLVVVEADFAGHRFGVVREAGDLQGATGLVTINANVAGSSPDPAFRATTNRFWRKLRQNLGGLLLSQLDPLCDVLGPFLHRQLRAVQVLRDLPEASVALNSTLALAGPASGVIHK